MAAKTVGKLAWHVHHEKLVEVLTEPLSTRVAYIKSSKPKHEIKTRLRLLKLVKWSVPPSLAKAGAAYDKAGAAYDKALNKHMPYLITLHAKECQNCSWDGHTIFPAK